MDGPVVRGGRWSARLRPQPGRRSSWVARLRERIVCGPIRRELSAGEEIAAWAHAGIPDARAPGVLIVTNRRCLVHVASSTITDRDIPLAELVGFQVDRRGAQMARVHLTGPDEELVVEMSLTHRVRSRAMGRVLGTLTRHQVVAPESFDPALTSPLPPMARGVRDHARRVLVTVAGIAVLALSAVFASPLVPGPGALTAVAGIAILAREYEWARDLHVWSARQVDRFLTWWRRRRSRRRGHR